VARAENWVSAELPLKSTPFAAELPLRQSSRPPPVEELEDPDDLVPFAPPLPASVSEALARRNSSVPPQPPRRSSPPPPPRRSSAPPAVAASALQTPSKSGSRWWVWGLLLLAAAAYFALRST
jgi:hypothetical protein